MNNIVLFIHGKASSGKDTFKKCLIYSWFIETHQYIPMSKVFDDTNANIHQESPIIQVNFADEVKRELCRLKPEVNLERLLTSQIYKEGFRKELIEIGDGYRKNKDPDIWVIKHREHLEKLLEKEKNKIFVITDMRYSNELDYAYRLSTSKKDDIVLTCKVDAPFHIRLARMSKEGALKYCSYGKYNDSENQLDEYEEMFDFHIHNNRNMTIIDHVYDVFQRDSEAIIKLHKKLVEEK